MHGKSLSAIDFINIIIAEEKRENNLPDKENLPEIITAIKRRCVTLLSEEKEKFVQENGEFAFRTFRQAMEKNPEIKRLIDFFNNHPYPWPEFDVGKDDIFMHIPVSDEEWHGKEWGTTTLTEDDLNKIREKEASIYTEIEEYKQWFSKRNNGDIDYDKLEKEMRMDPEWVKKFDFLGYDSDVFSVLVLWGPMEWAEMPYDPLFLERFFQKIDRGNLSFAVSAIKMRCLAILIREKEKFTSENHGHYCHHTFQAEMMHRPEIRKLVEFFNNFQSNRSSIFSFLPISDEEYYDMLLPPSNDIPVETVNFTWTKHQP